MMIRAAMCASSTIVHLPSPSSLAARARSCAALVSRFDDQRSQTGSFHVVSRPCVPIRFALGRFSSAAGSDAIGDRVNKESSFVDVERTAPAKAPEDVAGDSAASRGTQGLGDDPAQQDGEEEEEEEEMFVDAHPTFFHGKREWGGPRRGGKYEEPTRFGDWERKGRCTDF